MTRFSFAHVQAHNVKLDDHIEIPGLEGHHRVAELSFYQDPTMVQLQTEEGALVVRRQAIVKVRRPNYSQSAWDR